MKKYALIGLGTEGSKTVDSFDYDNKSIDKVAIDSDEECLNSLKNSRTVKINIEKENENHKLLEEDKKKISDLIKEYDTVCFLVCLWYDTYKDADIIKEIIKVHNDSCFIFIQTPLSFMGTKANIYAQEAIDYIKKVTKNVYVIDTKETLQRIKTFTEDDWDMQYMNCAIVWKHQKDFMRKFKSRFSTEEEK